MLDDDFKLIHDKGKLTAVITINGETYEMDVTDYFEKDNPHDDWLDYRLGLKELAKKSKLTKKPYPQSLPLPPDDDDFNFVHLGEMEE